MNMKIFLIVITVVLFVACIQKKEVQISIIPKPLNSEAGSGSFTITDETSVVSKTEEENNIGAFLIDALKKFNNITLTKRETENDAIILTINDTIKSLGDEGYRLIVTDKNIEITAGNPVGLFYGFQSLIQLCDVNSKGSVVVPSVKIEDHPRFTWRGMHLDESRHFHGKEFVKKYIDMLAMLKLNVFHWHLTDDQGWRIEIKQYPKLTSVGAWREDREGEIWNIDDDQRMPYPKGKPYYGGYYTQDDIREIVKYAQSRFINIVPEIEMPGHSRAALVAYPEVSCFGKETKVPSAGFVGEKWDFSDPYCAGKEETFEFIENVLDEIMDLFPSRYIHIGGDECSKRIWKRCPKCQARIKKENLKDEFELQSYFVKRIEKYLSSKGKRMIGWQEILEGGLAPEATVMTWRGDDALGACLEAAKQGHDVIQDPSEYLYFGGERLALSTVYNYEPVPVELTPEQQKFIIGVNACAWGEGSVTSRDVEFQVMPDMCALSEVAWVPRELKNWQDFNKRMNPMYSRLSAMDINYALPRPRGLSEKTVFTDKFTVAMKTPDSTFTVRYTTDSTQPTSLSKEYSQPFTVQSTTVIIAAAFDKFGHSGKTIKGIFEKQDFRKGVIVDNPIKGLKYKSFEGRIKAADLINQASLIKSGIVDSVGIVDYNGEADGGLLFEGYIQLPVKGLYNFYIASDDGSKLYIGESNVVNNDGFHQGKDKKGNLIMKSGQIALDRGLQPITIKYFDWGGGEFLKLFIEGPGLEKQEVKSNMLFH
jgi:hexosaminidase